MAFAGNLTVNLDPVAAVGAGAQWRVDGGNWRASGATVKNLSNTTHPVEYKAVTGWIAPAATSVSLSGNITITGTYVAAPSLKITLTPNSAQWQVDGGTWRASGTTASNLTAGSHTISYGAVSNYLPPAAESVMLAVGQATMLTRNYTAAGQLYVMLTPTTGQWRVDGGVWRASHTSSNLLAAGAHTLEFAPLTGYLAPPAETVTVTATQTTNLTRAYLVRPANLTVNVIPSSGQWRLRNGTWQASGATLTGLAPGSYPIELSSVPGWFDSEGYVELAENETRTITLSHSRHASITVTLAPGSAQWRVSGGLLPANGPWQPSGASVSALYASNYTLEYSPVAGMTAPASETFYLATGEQKAVTHGYGGAPSLTLNLTPATGQWRMDGGAWKPSGTVFFNVALGAHLIEYAPLSGYLAPPSETVSFRQNESFNFSRTFLAATGSYLNVKTLPAYLMQSGAAEWRADGGVWKPTGTPVPLSAGTHTIDFKPVAGLDVPPPSTVTVTTGAVQTLEATFFLTHRLRFFFNSNLTGSLTMADLQARVSRYATDIQTIFHRETLRRLSFNPATDITVVGARPFSGYAYPPLPELGFELWAYAESNFGNPYGSYGGYADLDTSGAGGAGGMHWTQIYDPTTLVAGSAELQQYARQIYTVVHEFEHTFGAGLGEYYSADAFDDNTGVAPLLSPYFYDLADPFWNAHSDFWTDPLYTSPWNNPRAGSPTSLPALFDVIHFSATSRGIINGCNREADMGSDSRTTLPDLTRVRISVVDATSGEPIPGATLRIWNQPNPSATSGLERIVTPTTTLGVFEFNWTSDASFTPLNNWDNGKLLKAFATGYQPKAQWEWVYDAQRVRTVDASDLWQITVALSAAP